ncbi:MAG TPA: hypothetical protein PLE55_06760 [Clostridiales bacterium]|nr:hypothetical protein [Clostridiales bacterium]
MKRVLLIALVGILLSTNIALAQNGLVNPEQIAGSTTRITATAGENITANDIVKIINDGGAQAYKYLKQFSNSFGSASVFESAYSIYISAVKLSDTKFVVCYMDNGNSNYGTAIVGTVAYTGLSIPAFATSSVTSGSSGTFTMLRPFSVITSPNLSLSPASQLFLNANSALSTTANANYYIGFATDTTSIFIDPYPYNQTAASTIPVSLQRK